MMLRKKLQADVTAQGEKAIRAVSIPLLIGVNIVTQLVTLCISAKGSVFPGADALMSIITTCSQIIAGLYGVTMAGYTFFLSRIDALMASDATLDYVVGSIKNRFKYLIWYITCTVLMTLFFSILLMYLPVPDGEEIGFFYRLFCNEFVLFVCFSIVLILYYSILVINPNCVEKEAAKLKKKLSRENSLGSAAEFIALYDRIEGACNAMIPEAVLRQIHENRGNRFEYTLELLHELRPQLRVVLPDLNRIHRYYECLVNCAPLTASREMCLLARRVCALLEERSVRRS